MKFKLVILMAGLGLVELFCKSKNFVLGNFFIEKLSGSVSFAYFYYFIRKNTLIFNRERFYKHVKVSLPVIIQGRIRSSRLFRRDARGGGREHDAKRIGYSAWEMIRCFGNQFPVWIGIMNDKKSVNGIMRYPRVFGGMTPEYYAVPLTVSFPTCVRVPQYAVVRLRRD